MKNDRYRLPYEAALRTIDQQMASLDELRQRASYMLATGFGAGGITASIIFTSDRTDDIGCLGLIGIALAAAGLLGVFAATVCIWRAAKLWHITLDAKKMVKRLDRTKNTAKVQRRYSLKMHKWIRDNRIALEKRMRWFNRGLWAMLAEIVGFALLIGDVAGG